MNTKTLNTSKINKVFFILSTVLLSIILCLTYIHFGKTKIGYDGDEVFSYMSSNAEQGYKKLATLEDHTWYPSSYFHSALSVSSSCQFHYGIPVRNQSTDVHPPIYYMLLHTVCSFFPESFSMWYGIFLNILLTLLSLTVLFFLLRSFVRGIYLPLFICFLLGMTYGVINNVLFIRMYVLLMLLFSLQYYCHLHLYSSLLKREDKWKPRQLIVLSLITITGTLSQYYFLIFLFWLAFIFCIVLLIQKKTKALLQYICTMAVSGIGCIVLYPTMLRHIFSGYRGEEAAHKLVKVQGVFEDMRDMLSILSRQLANRHLGLVLLILLVWAIILLLCKKISFKAILYSAVLAAPAALYFITVTKISPYVVDRYITPVYGIIFGLIAIGFIFLIKATIASLSNRFFKYLLCFICLLGGILTSFPRPGERMEQSRYWFADRNAVIKDYTKKNGSCIYISADEYHWKIWSEFPSFMEFDDIYYLDGIQWNPLQDKRLQQMDEILVYIEDGVDADKAKAYILSELGYRSCELAFESAFADGYLFSQPDVSSQAAGH